jgi:hypothetical protein
MLHKQHTNYCTYTNFGLRNIRFLRDSQIKVITPSDAWGITVFVNYVTNTLHRLGCRGAATLVLPFDIKNVTTNDTNIFCNFTAC